MNKRAIAVTGIALLAGLGAVTGAGIATAKPSSTITVQDEGSKDGAAVDADGTNGTVDADGTMGDYKQATDGTAVGPIMVASPQSSAK